jgi:hypothetical protein
MHHYRTTRVFEDELANLRRERDILRALVDDGTSSANEDSHWSRSMTRQQAQRALGRDDTARRVAYFYLAAEALAECARQLAAIVGKLPPVAWREMHTHATRVQKALETYRDCARLLPPEVLASARR